MSAQCNFGSRANPGVKAVQLKHAQEIQDLQVKAQAGGHGERRERLARWNIFLAERAIKLNVQHFVGEFGHVALVQTTKHASREQVGVLHAFVCANGFVGIEHASAVTAESGGLRNLAVGTTRNSAESGRNGFTTAALRDELPKSAILLHQAAVDDMPHDGFREIVVQQGFVAANDSDWRTTRIVVVALVTVFFDGFTEGGVDFGKPSAFLKRVAQLVF